MNKVGFGILLSRHRGKAASKITQLILDYTERVRGSIPSQTASSNAWHQYNVEIAGNTQLYKTKNTDNAERLKLEYNNHFSEKTRILRYKNHGKLLIYKIMISFRACLWGQAVITKHRRNNICVITPL